VADNPQTTEPQGKAAHASSAGLSLVSVVWRHKSLVCLGLVVGLGLAALYYFQAPPSFESKAKVLVVQRRPDSVTGIDTRRLSLGEDYASAHQEIVKSPSIIEKAIAKHHLETLTAFTPEEKENLTEAIGKRLTVKAGKTPTGAGNNILDLACQIRVPEEASLLLGSLLDSYRDFLDETYRAQSEDTLDRVKKTRDDLERELAQKKAAYREFRLKSPLITTSKEPSSRFRYDGLQTIQAKRAAVQLRRAELQSQLTAVEKARQEGLDPAAILGMIADQVNDRTEPESPRRTTGVLVQEQLMLFLAEEQKLLSTYGPDHPEVQSIRKKIDIAREMATRPSAAWRKPAPADGKGPRTDAVEEHVRFLKQRLQQVEDTDRLLAELYEKEYKAAKELSNCEVEDELQHDDIERTQKIYDTLVTRLQDVRLVRDVGGYDAKIIASPSAPKKVWPLGIVVFPAGLLLGVVLGWGLASLADATEKSLRTVEDVRRCLGLPVVGSVPPLSRGPVRPAAQGTPVLHPLLCTYHRSRSAEAEAFRAVRTALYFSSAGEHKVLQITSPGIGEGKSLLAANLAVSIAQSGKRVLLIDADMRKPRVHQLFGVTAERGLSSVLRGEADLPEAVQEGPAPGLWLLPCGPVPSNPSELLSAPRFEELLNLLRDQYDFVLLDTPPLLSVTDPGAVAPRVDGVLLTVRLARKGRLAAERAKEVLGTLGANVVGVVVNGADPWKSSGAAGYGYLDTPVDESEGEVRPAPAASPVGTAAQDGA
jgi:succinoglycan biosynthesis transport protein ExoP